MEILNIILGLFTTILSYFIILWWQANHRTCSEKEQEDIKKRIEQCKKVPSCSKPEDDLITLIMKQTITKAKLKTAVGKVNPNCQKQFHMKRGEETKTMYNLLMFAVHYEKFEAFKLLLEAGANPFWVNNKGTSVMIMIAKRGLLDMARLLDEKYPESEDMSFLVNLKNLNGWTPLMSSIENDKQEMCKWCLMKGADPNAKMFRTHWTAGHTAAAKQPNILFFKCQLVRFQYNFNSLASCLRYGGQMVVPQRLEIIEKEKEIANGLKRELNHYQTKFKFDGRKCLAVFVNVTHFKEAKDGPKYPQRSAADQDHVQMAKTLSDLVDCEIINALQTEKDKSKSNILKHLQKVADIYKNGDYGFLLLIFSSHGGTDSQGQFFVSSDIERIYCKEVRQIFACSRGSKIGRKPVIFIFTSCRHFVPDVNSLTPANPLNENELAIPAIGFTVNVTTRGNSALLFNKKDPASIAILLLKNTLEIEKGKISVRNWIYAAQERGLIVLEAGYKSGSSVVYQQFEIEGDTLLKDLEFKLKKSKAT